MNNGDRLKILVVDDRPENRRVMAGLLERPGLEVLTAASGNEALRLALDEDLALVLLDVQMPGMNGFEVAELMRRDERAGCVPIIFVTAIDKERRQIFTGYEAGCVDYLFKPVDPFILRAKVGVFLEMKRGQLARERLLRQLNRANNRLQELNERKSDFLAAASHELRTPLTVIREHCSLVHEGVVGDLNEDQRHCVGVALRNCRRLAALVDDLLDLNGIETGYTACSRGPLDAGALLATCVGDFRGTCAGAEQELTLDAAADLPPVLADPALLTQVIVNLLGNARKHTPAGGRITVTARPAGDQVRIAVIDTGPGVPPRDRERVFERFTRLDGPGSEQRGTGLGLAIARRIVELHDGAIGVAGEPGRGAEFWLELPVCTAENRLAAFVADGTRSPCGGDDPWTLVVLEPDAGGDIDAVAAALAPPLRRGADRCMTLHHDGRDRVVALLGTDRNGALAFLARFEHEAAALAGAVRFGLVDLPPARRTAFVLGPKEPALTALSLSLPPLGGDQAARTPPVR